MEKCFVNLFGCSTINAESPLLPIFSLEYLRRSSNRSKIILKFSPCKYELGSTPCKIFLMSSIACFLVSYDFEPSVIGCRLSVVV